MDRQQLYSKVTFPTTHLLPPGDFIQAICTFLLSNHSLAIEQSINRNANVVTHNLAHMGTKLVAHQLWFNNIPYQLILIVSSDILLIQYKWVSEKIK